MAFKDLPAKYYLSHFFEWIDFLEKRCEAVLEEKHLKFLSHFRSLPENTQCVFVRMINRKGRIFNKKDFEKYQEIENLENAFQELTDRGLAHSPHSQDKELFLDFLTKPKLHQWLKISGISLPASASRENLMTSALQNLEALDLNDLEDLSDLLVQDQTEELEYLLFIFFGRLQKSLNLYTLRDLGIRQSNNKEEFRSRFRSIKEAQAEYALSKLLESSLSPHKIFELSDQVPIQTPSAKKLQDQILLKISQETPENDLAFTALKKCQSPPARERLCRLLYKDGKKGEAKQILKKIFDHPWSDEELLFAEDFWALKFEGKRIGSLTETLRGAKEIVLSDFYLKRPEQGVRNHFREQGFEAHFTENYLWTGLFGLLFWNELFENDKASIFNPFDRFPTDLGGPEFYQKNKIQVEQKLSLLQDQKSFEFYLLKAASEHYGILNDVFQWHPNLVKVILDFTRCARSKDLPLVLRTMAMDFAHHHSGFPDLMILKEEGPYFIEVKAEGDSLRSKQLSKIRLLREAGFQAEVLKVRWESDPHQCYVVVDVETTGGPAKFHRITEIAAVKIQSGKIKEEFHSLIHPGRPIPKNIIRVTDITDEMVRDAPSFSDIADSFLEFTEGCIFVAHNVRFDYSFIQKEFQRLGKEFVRPTICTVTGMRRSFPGLSSYSLKNLTEHFGIALEQHHRALYDARAASALLLMIQDQSCGL